MLSSTGSLNSGSLSFLASSAANVDLPAPIRPLMLMKMFSVDANCARSERGAELRASPT